MIQPTELLTAPSKVKAGKSSAMNGVLTILKLGEKRPEILLREELDAPDAPLKAGLDVVDALDDGRKAGELVCISGVALDVSELNALNDVTRSGSVASSGISRWLPYLNCGK